LFSYGGERDIMGVVLEMIQVKKKMMEVEIIDVTPK